MTSLDRSARVFAVAASLIAACGDNSNPARDGTNSGSDGPPGADINQNPHDRGDPAVGKSVFRDETFGNENFWTDAVKLPQGIVAAGFTPKQALIAGYNVNIDKLDPTTQAAIAAELTTDLSPQQAPLLTSGARTSS